MSFNRKPDGDLDRLPKWAQRYIFSLQNEIMQQDAHIKELSSEHPGSGVYVRNYARPDQTLPSDTRIRFDVPGPRNADGYIEVHCSHGRVEVRGSDALIIRPSASNSVNMTVGEY